MERNNDNRRCNGRIDYPLTVSNLDNDMIKLNLVEVTNVEATPKQNLVEAVASLVARSPKAQPFLDGKRTKEAARDFIGLSKNSKMPSWTFAIPAREACPRGGQLAKIEGTVCYGCYAAKGLDAMPIAQTAKARRWAVLEIVIAHEELAKLYVEAYQVALKGEKYFRWHSAGDIYSAEYAALMAEVIKTTPDTMHWIPTRQANRASAFQGLSNCVLRVSDDMVDQTKNKFHGLTSGVHTVETRGIECQAYNNNGECGDCRQCWNSDVQHISYKLH